jgi:hypothetical protein
MKKKTIEQHFANAIKNYVLAFAQTREATTIEELVTARDEKTVRRKMLIAIEKQFDRIGGNVAELARQLDAMLLDRITVGAWSNPDTDVIGEIEVCEIEVGEIEGGAS